MLCSCQPGEFCSQQSRRTADQYVKVCRIRHLFGAAGGVINDKYTERDPDNYAVPDMNNDHVTQITEARGKPYGPFEHNAYVAQAIKMAMCGQTHLHPSDDNDAVRRKWEQLPPHVRLALEMIALKISRIISGNPSYLDNWDDIGGYAKIVADRIRRERAPTPGVVWPVPNGWGIAHGGFVNDKHEFFPGNIYELYRHLGLQLPPDEAHRA